MAGSKELSEFICFSEFICKGRQVVFHPTPLWHWPSFADSSIPLATLSAQHHDSYTHATLLFLNGWHEWSYPVDHTGVDLEVATATTFA